MNEPDFLAIDIGKSTIKVVGVKKINKTDFMLCSIGAIDFPSKLASVIPQKEKVKVNDLEILAASLKTLVNSTGLKIKQVVSALPESVIFSKLLSGLPVVDPAKFEEMIYWEAKQFIPIPIDQAQSDWIEVQRSKNADGKEISDVMVIAAPRDLVETYLKVFEMAELELIALEVESVALARASRFNYPELQDNCMIIDFGATRTNICVVFNGRLIFSQSIATGSDALTKAIVSDFNLQFAQAEQYKMKFGILQGQSDGGRIGNSILPILNILINEVRKTLGFISSRLNYGMPEHLLILGNGALLPGLDLYISKNLNIPTAIFDPLKNISVTNDFEKAKDELKPAGYAVAIGLAIKDE